MATIKFVHGNQSRTDYVPGADVAAGVAILVGGTTVVTTDAIASGERGSVAVPDGRGVYRLEKDNPVDVFADDADVWVEIATGEAFTINAVGREYFGKRDGPDPDAGGANGDTYVNARHLRV